MACRDTSSTRHANAFQIEQENLPPELISRARWLTWRYKRRVDARGGGSWTKPPDQPIDDPAKWLSLEAALQLALRNKAHGLGYVLGAGLTGIDLDNILEGEIVRDALALRSYSEISPSRRGLHVLIHGTIPRNRNIRSRCGVPGREIYAASRYFTVTGWRFGDATGIASGPEAQRLLQAFYAKWFSDAVG